MQVQQLIQFFDALEVPIRVVGGAKGANDLQKTAAALQPFAAMKVEELAEFLVIAQHYRQTGEVPLKAGKAKSTRAKTIDPAKINAAAQEYQALYERSIDTDVEYADMEKQLKAIEKRFTAPEAKELALQLDVPKSIKAKGKIFEALKKRLFERKESFQRASF